MLPPSSPQKKPESYCVFHRPDEQLSEDMRLLKAARDKFQGPGCNKMKSEFLDAFIESNGKFDTGYFKRVKEFLCALNKL